MTRGKRTDQPSRPFRSKALRVAAATIGACATLLMLGGLAAQKGLPPTALWEVVHNVCVPGQVEYHDPKPCLQVDLTGGDTNGFAILREPRGTAQFLLVPTARISGIESPVVRAPDATNYFAHAWDARTYINDALHRTLPRDSVILVINSARSRSQEQMHIHMACARTDIVSIVHKNEARIGSAWTDVDLPFYGTRFMARWVEGERLGANNPFSLLAERPGVVPNMGNHLLAVLGLTRSDGAKGFVLLTDEVNDKTQDRANGEELLDHACRIAATAPDGN